MTTNEIARAIAGQSFIFTLPKISYHEVMKAVPAAVSRMLGVHRNSIWYGKIAMGQIKAGAPTPLPTGILKIDGQKIVEAMTKYHRR